MLLILVSCLLKNIRIGCLLSSNFVLCLYLIFLCYVSIFYPCTHSVVYKQNRKRKKNVFLMCLCCIFLYLYSLYIFIVVKRRSNLANSLTDRFIKVHYRQSVLLLIRSSKDHFCSLDLNVKQFQFLLAFFFCKSDEALLNFYALSGGGLETRGSLLFSLGADLCTSQLGFLSARVMEHPSPVKIWLRFRLC